MLAAIWAQDENGLIGREQVLPWHLPNDLAFFKNMTENNTIVMGRTTFEGMGKRPLPNRNTIVLTRDETYQAEGVLVLHSKTEVLNYAEKFEGITFITGGSNVYGEFLENCSILYRTVIHAEFEGDAYFPTLDWDEWTMINISEGLVDEKNPYKHSFETYQRKAV